MRMCAVVLALCGCGHKAPKAEWVEHEARPGDTHDTKSGGLGTATGPGTIDPTQIDSLDEGTVLAALERAGDNAPAARLALRAARLAYHRGDEADARALIARAANAADEPSVHAELTGLATALAAPPVQPGVIAVLLPLSGRFAAIGSELKIAIQLAQAPGTTWKFIDTKGEPDGAVAAVDAALAAGAVAILGPVGQREAIAAARQASLRQIPIALLAPSDGGDPAAGVFRMVDSAADEGRAAARLAAADSFPTVGVFAPRDDLGAEAAEAFVAEAQRLGLAVT
ncbi:MAG: penicillin-binding protein activator, partial [Deltaproteobacteria bacterium]|nr:penicillin-binding protein activator [Deltaproteobacteria bacterium]